METLDVPEVFQVAENIPDDAFPISAFADMVLTTLLGFDSALLCAEHSDPTQSSVSWFIHSAEAGVYSRGIEIATLPSHSHFRGGLARFGHHYMGGQLYGGYTLLSLRQRGRVHRCHIYMSNNNQSGFWIRVYASVT